MNKNKMSIAVSGVIGAAVLAGSITSYSFADDHNASEIEEVFVTGSRISRPDLEGASPVTVITREAMIETGVTDVGALIQRMPQRQDHPLALRQITAEMGLFTSTLEV